MKKQIPPQPDDAGTHYDRFMEIAAKVANTSNKEYQEHVEQEKQEKAKKRPEQS
jgi:hypothetical protein